MCSSDIYVTSSYNFISPVWRNDATVNLLLRMMFLKLAFWLCALLLMLPSSTKCEAKSLSETTDDEVELANLITCGDLKFKGQWNIFIIIY